MKTRTIGEMGGWGTAVVAAAVAMMAGAELTAAPAIGVAMGRGAFHLDASKVAGTGTLFEGSLIETGKVGSRLKLNSGARLTLDSDTRGRIYGDRLLLERGTGQLDGGAGYRIDAGTLRVEGATAKVSMTSRKRILVAALGGPVRVRTNAGLLVAKLEAGRAVELEDQESGASVAITINGPMKKQEGFYLLTDSNSGVTYDVQGENFDRYVGKSVEIQGTLVPSAKPAPGASQVVMVSKSRVLGGAIGSGGAGGGAGAGGGIIGAKTVIGGIIVAGAATGSALALTQEEGTDISQ